MLKAVIVSKRLKLVNSYLIPFSHVKCYLKVSKKTYDSFDTKLGQGICNDSIQCIQMAIHAAVGVL